MTFIPPRIALGHHKTSGKIELLRYATKYNIIGGFSKLLKYFINNYKNQYSEIITYADLKWSDYKNNVYEKNGFTCDHISAPGYSYYDQHTFKQYSRYSFRKQALKTKFPAIYDEKLTEFQIMDKTKYLRIWDCGNAVYKLKI